MGKIKLRFDLIFDFKSFWIRDSILKLRKSILEAAIRFIQFVILQIRFIPMRDLCQSEMRSKVLRAAPNFVLKQRNMSS